MVPEPRRSVKVIGILFSTVEIQRMSWNTFDKSFPDRTQARFEGNRSTDGKLRGS